MLGENLAAQGKFQEAEPLLTRSHEAILRLSEDEATFFPIDSYGRVIRLYNAWAAAEPRIETSTGSPKSELGRPYREGLARVTARANWPITWPFARFAFAPEHVELLALADDLESRLGANAYTVVRGDRNIEGVLADLQALFELSRQELPVGDSLHLTLARVAMTWINATDDSKVRSSIARHAIPLLEPGASVIPLDLAEALAAEACSGENDSRLEEALELAHSWEEDDSWYTANAKARIARCFLERGRSAEARSLLEPAEKTLEAQLGPTSRDYLEIRRLLGKLEGEGDG